MAQGNAGRLLRRNLMHVVDIRVELYPIPFGLTLASLRGRPPEGEKGGRLGAGYVLVQRWWVLAGIELLTGFVGR